MTSEIQRHPDSALPGWVRIETTARLHLGFIDLHGGLGRKFGSIGLSLDRPTTSLRATRAASFSAEGPASERVLKAATKFAEGAGLAGGAHFHLEAAIPDHAGLGSGTQIGLAVGTALSALYGMRMTSADIAMLTGRGHRSGIGIGAFDAGGLIVDGGRSQDTRTPPVIARLDFPEEWRVLLVTDLVAQGVHGQAELKAFGELPVFPEDSAREIAHRVLMQAMPAVVERDLAGFGAAISRIQAIVGAHFAPAQGGSVFASRNVEAAMNWLAAHGVGCLGQSSWGPTGFAVVADQGVAEQLAPALEAECSGVRVVVCRALNRGAKIETGPDAGGSLLR